jgi:hypothetical protein
MRSWGRRYVATTLTAPGVDKQPWQGSAEPPARHSRASRLGLSRRAPVVEDQEAPSPQPLATDLFIAGRPRQAVRVNGQRIIEPGAEDYTPGTCLQPAGSRGKTGSAYNPPRDVRGPGVNSNAELRKTKKAACFQAAFALFSGGGSVRPGVHPPRAPRASPTRGPGECGRRGRSRWRRSRGRRRRCR